MALGTQSARVAQLAGRGAHEVTHLTAVSDNNNPDEAYPSPYLCDGA